MTILTDVNELIATVIKNSQYCSECAFRAKVETMVRFAHPSQFNTALQQASVNQLYIETHLHHTLTIGEANARH